MSRYRLLYADRRYGDTGRYVVVNGGERRQHNSKIDAIVDAQTLNGYEPVDGSESTYGAQIAHEALR